MLLCVVVFSAFNVCAEYLEVQDVSEESVKTTIVSSHLQKFFLDKNGFKLDKPIYNVRIREKRRVEISVGVVTLYFVTAEMMVEGYHFDTGFFICTAENKYKSFYTVDSMISATVNPVQMEVHKKEMARYREKVKNRVGVTLAGMRLAMR